MRKFLFFLLVLIFIIGCWRTPKEKIIVAKVNNYEITKEEFEQEFKDSVYSRQDTLQSRKEFLDNLINRKLILQDAQKKGLDKNNDFLKTVEKFWEQSLLKIALDKKTKELAGSASVSDKDIEEAYSKMPADVKADKPYENMYTQIKWELTRFKESQQVNDWVSGLRKKAAVTVNNDLLK